MLTMKMYLKIKKCKVKKMSIRQMAKFLDVTRKTVSKYFRMDEESCLNYRLSLEAKEKKFESFKDEFLEFYQRNDNRIYKSSIYDVLEEKHGPLPGMLSPFVSTDYQKV